MDNINDEQDAINRQDFTEKHEPLAPPIFFCKRGGVGLG